LYGRLAGQDESTSGALSAPLQGPELLQPGLARESQAWRSISAMPDNKVTDGVTAGLVIRQRLGGKGGSATTLLAA
jgi:hypothetical protein